MMGFVPEGSWKLTVVAARSGKTRSTSSQKRKGFEAAWPKMNSSHYIQLNKKWSKNL